MSRRLCSAFRKVSISATSPAPPPRPPPRFRLYGVGGALATTAFCKVSAAATTAPAYGCSPRDGREVRKTDLASDEALWALYERWYRQYHILRTPDEMKSRFNTFKEEACTIYVHNNSNSRNWHVLGPFADLTQEEWKAMFPPLNFKEELEMIRLSRSPGGNENDDLRHLRSDFRSGSASLSKELK